MFEKYVAILKKKCKKCGVIFLPNLLILCQAPSWVYIINAVCVFAHQCLDNVDVMQAQKTKVCGTLRCFDCWLLYFEYVQVQEKE